MKLTVKFWLTTILFSLSILESYSQLIINEIMQSNVDCITDDLNEFPDSWVELYNSSKSIVNLGEYKIGVTDRPEDAWQLRSENVASGRYVIIYCDKEANGKHTNFRLESDKGGAVYLFHNNEVPLYFRKRGKVLIYSSSTPLISSPQFGQKFGILP